MLGREKKPLKISSGSLKNKVLFWPEAWPVMKAWPIMVFHPVCFCLEAWPVMAGAWSIMPPNRLALFLSSSMIGHESMTDHEKLSRNILPRAMTGHGWSMTDHALRRFSPDLVQDHDRSCFQPWPVMLSLKSCFLLFLLNQVVASFLDIFFRYFHF